jgi:hypothetical protein
MIFVLVGSGLDLCHAVARRDFHFAEAFSELVEISESHRYLRFLGKDAHRDLSRTRSLDRIVIDHG